MRRAFTLIELLVVIAIMGTMGTMAVGGYRAMQRGMEERGVIQNVNQFVRSAYQRAQIDRVPTAVYFWNETIRAETDTDPQIVVGRAVAVRRAGRLSKVVGNYLYDEFGDLSNLRLTLDEDEEESESGEQNSGSTAAGNGMYLYYMGSQSDTGFKRSIVAQTTKKMKLNELLLSTGGMADIPCYAYVMTDPGGCRWKTGDAYGFEFAELQLPHNFIFGTAYSKNVSSPVTEIGVLRFRVSGNSGSGSKSGASGADTIEIGALRPDASGNVAAQRIATSDSPTKSLYN